MPSFNPRRFANPKTLQSLSPDVLWRFLQPHSAFIESKGFALPDDCASMSGFDYLMLTSILMSPDDRMPQEMIDALYFTHEMGADRMMDDLLRLADGLGLNVPPESTPMDVAMRIWVADSGALEKKHGERHILRTRTFEHYHAEQPVIYREPSPEGIARLEAAFDAWFTEHKLGGNCKVFVYQGEEDVWFLIRRGDTYKRESAVQGYNSRGIFFRPEAFDVAWYVKPLGELRIHAKSKGMRDLYRRELGRLITGDPYCFPGEEEYELAPLREDGHPALYCKDVPGMDWVQVASLRVKRRSVFGSYRVDYTAPNVFLIFSGAREGFQPHDVIERARFVVKFSDSEKPRSVTLTPPNKLQICRDGDLKIITKWLAKRGFIVGMGARNEGAEDTMASL